MGGGKESFVGAVYTEGCGEDVLQATSRTWAKNVRCFRSSILSSSGVIHGGDDSGGVLRFERIKQRG